MVQAIVAKSFHLLSLNLELLALSENTKENMLRV
jgi:hypothetical protein